MFSLIQRSAIAMQISIQMPPITINVDPSDSIDNIKFKIQEKTTPIPTYYQKLSFSGKQLEDGRSVLDYGIQDGATLILKIAPGG